ncbi:nitroreductase family protein [Rhodococcus sp. NPDC060086]|uniref:nitroreductase family protein n=1 Tax=Rhodococcus sp. NPDC060086 TaxID=3347055 RepID=UPI0036698B7E
MTASTGERAAVLDDLLTERQSCRALSDAPVPRDLLDELLTMAQGSPSWCNTQPWHLTLASHAPFLRARIGLPEHRKILLGISFGFADREHPANAFRTNRADIDTAATVIS